MDSAALVGIIGVGAGLVGALAGFAAILWGLGFKEYMGGKKAKYTGFSDKETLKKKLLELNSPDLPYQITPSAETDLALEWKIADARWFALFAKERLKKTYRAFLVLDELRRSVRYCEELATVQWAAGSEGPTPNLSYERQFFRGRILFQKSWGVQYGIKEDLSLGKVYEYKFDVNRVRDPIRKIVEENGWEFVPVVRKAHATYKSLRASI